MIKLRGFVTSIAVWAVLGATVVGGITYKAYDIGRDSERSEWLEKELIEQKAHEAEVRTLNRKLEEHRKELARRLSHQKEKLVEIQNERIQETQKRSAAIRKLRDSKLYITTQCNRAKPGGVHGDNKTENTITSSSTPGRVELSRETAESLIRIVEDAQTVVDQYNALRRWTTLVTDVVDGNVD